MDGLSDFYSAFIVISLFAFAFIFGFIYGFVMKLFKFLLK